MRSEKSRLTEERRRAWRSELAKPVQLHVQITIPMDERLDLYTIRHGVSRSEAVRRILKEGLNEISR